MLAVIKFKTMTAQIGETIVYKGENLWTYYEPLKPYLEKNIAIKFDLNTTANWKGYQGEWQIVDNKLFLCWIIQF